MQIWKLESILGKLSCLSRNDLAFSSGPADYQQWTILWSNFRKI
jgi:hypothetical protein